MSYNSTRDELFLADKHNRVVRAITLNEKAGHLPDVYIGSPHDTSPDVYSVCHMNDLDILLVSSGETGPDRRRANWLVALRRNGTKWCEAQRVQTDGKGLMCCALSSTGVLIGNGDYMSSKYMERFCIDSGPRIVRVNLIKVHEEYRWFSAMCSSDGVTLVAMSFYDQSVRVNQLNEDRLDELSRILLNEPNNVLWLADRLLVTEYYSNNNTNSYPVVELEIRGERLERRLELITSRDRACVRSWCEVNDGLVIFDGKSVELMHWEATIGSR